ncbi:MAG: NUDIX domain-containing protein [Chloroflexi bacterium]|nr:NUDIX domain-containing protein [Chloroflexota bacterium]
MNALLYSTRWIHLYQNQHGNAYIKMADGVMTVPLTPSNDVIFINEYAVAYDQPILYLPAGAVTPGEALRTAANRELQEEAGVRAEKLQFLGMLRPFSKYLRCEFHIFLARDLIPSKLTGDETWDIQVEQIPLVSTSALIANGRLQDGLAIAALILAQQALELEG